MSSKYPIAIIINGKPGSGKDTFVDAVQLVGRRFKPMFFIMNISTVDNIKEAAKLMGWNGQKTPEARKFLSDLKDISIAFNDYPSKYVINEVLTERECKGNTKFVFIHCREPEEIDKIKQGIGEYCYTLLLKREGSEIEEVTTNHADMNTENYNYDIVVHNRKTLQYVNVLAEKFVKFFMTTNEEDFDEVIKEDGPIKFQ